MLASFVRVLCAVVVSLSAVAAQPWSAAGVTDSPAGTIASEQSEEPLPQRILLYGDSLTMGFSGDWTWRYRLWQSLTASGTPFDLVGPRNDMLGYVSRHQFSQDYRDPAFDRDHASYGGMTFSRPLWQLSSLANYYRPDVVVGQIGINDLLQKLRTPAQLVEMWRIQIARVRYWQPHASIVLVRQPQTWWGALRVYNTGLAALAQELDTPQSRVIITEEVGLDPYVDTYDYMHPSPSGERKIAESVATALAGLGVGSVGQLAGLVDPPSAVTWAPTPEAHIDSGILTITWPAVDYAYKQDVYVEDLTAGPPGAPVTPTRVTGTAWSMPVRPGHTYQLWLAPVKGFLPMGTQSAPVIVEPEVVPEVP